MLLLLRGTRRERVKSQREEEEREGEGLKLDEGRIHEIPQRWGSQRTL